MKINISRKLILGFSTVLLLLATVSIIAYVQFTIVDKNYKNVIEDSFKKTKLISEMENTILKEQIYLRGYLVNSNTETLQKFQESSQNFSEVVEEFLSFNVSNEAKEIVNEFVAVEKEYTQLANELIVLKDENKNDEITQLMVEKGNGLATKITEVGDKARLFQETSTTETSNKLSEDTKTSKMLIVIISSIALVSGLFIALYISRNISLPVQKISKSAKKIADGDLLIDEIRVRNRDEIGDLTDSFNLMVNNLRELIFKVSNTSETVASSAEELMASAEQTSSAITSITTAIQEVASGAEVQGSSTRESAKLVSEMLNGVKRLSVTSTNVADSTSETAIQANTGNEMLQKVVVQMESINNSTNETNKVIRELDSNSKQIGDIIGVITGIADQTNLLALNAAIESARAGEHGKGFAVVANEVRKLAEQSRLSASQIANLVQLIQSDVVRAVDMMNNGTSEVTKGRVLVEDTGKAFGMIITAIENVSAEIQELSNVSEQMSTSMEQVNASIDQVIQISKQSIDNTAEIASVSEEQLATVEEVTSSASNLSNMAEDLRELIRGFKI
ncbi:methyl-accepting chemotaxis protein [Bacillus coreaensis]